jgi:predicted O-linked N-acetylglucosamine transferase (SPINDLY family)
MPRQRVDQAQAACDRGDWAQVERLCKSELAVEPHSVKALLLLGIAAGQSGRHDEAAACLKLATSKSPLDPEAHARYGWALGMLGQFEQALRSFDRSLEIRPHHVETCYNRGVALALLGRHSLALDDFDRTLRLAPRFALAHVARGNALQELARSPDALGAYDEALRVAPLMADAHARKGWALESLGRLAEALASYTQAIAIQPGDIESQFRRGFILQAMRRSAEALASYDYVLRIKPDHAAARNNRVPVLVELGRLAEALASLDSMLTMSPPSAYVHQNRGNLLRMLGRLDQAEQSYSRALELSPNIPWLRGVWLSVRMQMCQWDGFESHVTALVADVLAGKQATTPFALIGLVDSPDVQHRAVASYIAAHVPMDPLPPITPRSPGERICVGYYSSDFHNHATSYLIAELFERHDRSKFRVLAFSFGPDADDEMRRRISMAVDEFIEVRHLSDRAIAEQSRKYGIDIAVDLKGFTTNARYGIFAYRAAPIQINYLGYPGSMGGGCIDYLIADATVAPPRRSNSHGEKIVYLPRCYQVNDRKRRIADHTPTRGDLGLPEKGFVFCCFNNAYKITPATFDSWARILTQVPGSVLWLLEDNSWQVANLRLEAGARGLTSDRLIFARRVPLADHLARHKAADLFIDTLPCNAHTTASDALWSGVPVLTQVGESFASRVAASLLNAVDLPELITTSPTEYERLAVELATHPTRLARIAEILRDGHNHSALFDTDTFTRDLERVYGDLSTIIR